MTDDPRAPATPPAAEDPPRRKIYLGDGAYAALDDRGLALTAENGIAITDTVVLGPGEVVTLLDWLTRESVLPSWERGR